MERSIQTDRIYSLIGLARKAGQVAIGHAAVEAAVKKGRAKLVIIANDAAQNTKDRFKITGKRANIACAYAGDKSTWGQLFGRESAAVFAILEKGFAAAIRGELGKKPPGEN